MSAPAMNVRPAQTITMAWAAESEMACLRPSWRPCRTCWLSALTGGLLTVSTATRPRRSRSTDLVMAVMGLSSEVLAADGLYSYTMTTSTVEHPSVCPLDCPDTCSLTVSVEAGHITKIRGSRANPFTAGVLCSKVPESYPEFVHGPGRLTTPLRRTGAKGEGAFAPISWSGLHMTPVIDRARRNGARLVVIDPKRTKIAERADLHLPVKPGTDVVLAWATAAELERRGGIDRAFVERHVAGYEEYMALARKWTLAAAARECGLVETAIQQLAEWFRTISPVAVSVGNGLERNQNGGSGVRAVFALPALAGKLGVKGGGLVNGARGAFPKTPAKLARPDLVPKGTRTLNIVDVGRHLPDATLAPQLTALFVYNHNPLVVHPDQNRMRRGLAREDLFAVASDVVMTDSLAYADVLLPACSHFEHDDLFAAYGTHWLQRAEPVIPPQGEALPNTEIFRRLAARFGFDDPAFTATDAQLMDDAIDGADPRLGGVPPSRIPPDAALLMTFDGAPANLFANVLPTTPSGKVEL